MRAIILSAGQGSRLLPLTERLPKCLLDLGEGQSVLRWQIRQLEGAGVTAIDIVTGFHAPLVDEDLACYHGPVTLRTIFNPFFKVADNLGSVWLALRDLPADTTRFMIVNGDTLFTTNVAKQLLQAARAPITLAVSQKPRYDADDMKVIREGSRLRNVGKSLGLDQVDGESIGMMVFEGSGITEFRRMVEETIASPEGTNVWYLSVLNRLAQASHVETAEVPADLWCEVDFPADYEHAKLAVAQWRGQ